MCGCVHVHVCKHSALFTIGLRHDSLPIFAKLFFFGRHLVAIPSPCNHDALTVHGGRSTRPPLPVHHRMVVVGAVILVVITIAIAIAITIFNIVVVIIITIVVIVVVVIVVAVVIVVVVIVVAAAAAR